MLQIKKYEYEEEFYVEEITDEEEEDMIDNNINNYIKIHKNHYR